MYGDPPAPCDRLGHMTDYRDAEVGGGSHPRVNTALIFPMPVTESAVTGMAEPQCDKRQSRWMSLPC